MKQKKNTEKGRSLGGMNGVRTSSYKEDEITMIALDIIKNDLTLVEASSKYNIPMSTLYDNLLHIKNEKLEEEIIQTFNNHKIDRVDSHRKKV